MTSQEPSGIQPPLYELLRRREAEGRAVRIGLVGAGQMDTDSFIYKLRSMQETLEEQV